MEIKVGESTYYMDSEEYKRLHKFYNRLLYGKESLS